MSGGSNVPSGFIPELFSVYWAHELASDFENMTIRPFYDRIKVVYLALVMKGSLSDCCRVSSYIREVRNPWSL